MDKPNHLNYPNTEEGFAAYDRDLAAYNRQQNPLMGKELADNIESTVGAVAGLPGIKQGLTWVGGAAKFVDETMTQDEGIGGQLYRSYQTLKDTSEQQFGDLAENLGFDRRFGSFAGGELIDTLTTAGTASIAGKASTLIKNLPTGGGMSPSLVSANGSIQFSAPQIPKGGPVMEAVTVNNPKVLDTTGRKLGEEIIEKDPELAKHLVKRGSTIQRYENDILRAQEIKRIMPKGSPEYKAAERVIKKRRPKMYSEGSNVKPPTPEDPQQYGTTAAPAVLERNKARAERMQKGIKISEKIHEHHLVTKGGTFAAFRKMEEFIAAGKAELDDLVLMFEYAEKRKAVPGDRRSNISFIDETPHNELHQEVLKPAGDEFTQKQWNKILDEVKTPEDLMNWWVDQVDNNYVPNKQTGMIWQDLDNLIKQIRSE